MTKEPSIRLSPEHGVNPSLNVCFYCGEDMGIVLFGKLKGDAKAPRRICMDREPCDKCKKLMEQGIMLISVDGHKTTDPDDPYRSGKLVVIREEALERMLPHNSELREDLVKKRCAFIDDETWEYLGLPMGGEGDQENERG